MKIEDTVLYEGVFPVTITRSFRFRAPKSLDIDLDVHDMIIESLRDGLDWHVLSDCEDWEHFDELEIRTCNDREVEHPKYATKLVLIAESNRSQELSDEETVYSLQSIDRYDEESDLTA